MLDFDLFTRVIDEAGPSLGRIDFFNYGETFLHKRAVEMCEYIKHRFPSIYLYTSTNGLAFSEDGARRLVRSGIDEVTFSIDGATPASYAKYRQRGDFEKALRFLRLMAEEKRAAGLDVPVLNWRYILFTWNDSDEEMNLARSLASDIGIDRLCWEVTDHPEDSFSRRFAPGTATHASIRHEIWDDNNLGNAIPGAMPRARIDVGGARSTDRPRAPPLANPHARQEPLRTTVSGDRELRPASGAPRGAAVRSGWQAAESRLCASLAASNAGSRGQRRRPDRDRRSRTTRALRAQVRFGERRD
jgi:hypothetical protein